MKEIALVLPAMRMGGAEKIALNFIDDLKKYYKVYLVLDKKEGSLLSEVPNDIEIIENRIKSFNEIVKKDISGFKPINLLKDFIYFLKEKLKVDREKNHSYLIKRSGKLDKKFDSAIVYVANVSTQIFSGIHRINADKKIAWIHGETNELKNVKLFTKYYNLFDYIFCVSNVSREHFRKRFPCVSTNTMVYYNRIRAEIINSKANEPIERLKQNDEIVLVTVARLTHEKGCSMIPKIVGELVEKKHKVKWYVVGNGNEFEIIKKDVSKLKLEDKIFLLGEKKNPYPYVKNCDIYVQPSFEEGYSTTICEAGILGKVIIGTTTSGGIREQLEDGVSGIIVEPTPKDIAEGIERIISDKKLKENIEKVVALKDFSNVSEIQKLKEII